MTQNLPPVDPNVFYIHQTWKNQVVPDKWQTSYDNCQILCQKDPSLRYVLWTDEMNREIVAQHYPWFLAKYDAYPKPIMKCDVARSFFLHRYGGLYIDLDLEPQVDEMYRFLNYIRAIEKPPWTFVFETANQWHDQYYTNGIMASLKANDVFWPEVWKRYEHPFKNKEWKRYVNRIFPKYCTPIFQTGPGTISDAAQQVPVRVIGKATMHTLDKYDHSPKIVRILEGSSWHENNDLQTLQNLSTFWRHRDAFLWPLVFIFGTLFIVFCTLYGKLKASLRNT